MRTDQSLKMIFMVRASELAGAFFCIFSHGSVETCRTFLQDRHEKLGYNMHKPNRT
jgi:hypothetical protein